LSYGMDLNWRKASVVRRYADFRITELMLTWRLCGHAREKGWFHWSSSPLMSA